MREKWGEKRKKKKKEEQGGGSERESVWPRKREIDSEKPGEKAQKGGKLTFQVFSASHSSSYHFFPQPHTTVLFSILIPQLTPEGRKEARQASDFIHPTPSNLISSLFHHGTSPFWLCPPHLPHTLCCARSRWGLGPQTENQEALRGILWHLGWGNTSLDLQVTWERILSRAFRCPRDWRVERSKAWEKEGLNNCILPFRPLRLIHRWPFLVSLLDSWVRIIICPALFSRPLYLGYWSFLTVFPVRCTFPTKNSTMLPKSCRVAPGSPLLV